MQSLKRAIGAITGASKKQKTEDPRSTEEIITDITQEAKEISDTAHKTLTDHLTLRSRAVNANFELCISEVFAALVNEIAAGSSEFVIHLNQPVEECKDLIATAEFNNDSLDIVEGVMQRINTAISSNEHKFAEKLVVELEYIRDHAEFEESSDSEHDSSESTENEESEIIGARFRISYE